MKPNKSKQRKRRKMEMYCICSEMSSVGDAAPRLWRCSLHGLTGMIGEVSAIQAHAEDFGISRNDAMEEAYNLLKSKQQQASEQREVYFCEDRFLDDLLDFYQIKKEMRSAVQRRVGVPKFPEDRVSPTVERNLLQRLADWLRGSRITQLLDRFTQKQHLN